MRGCEGTTQTCNIKKVRDKGENIIITAFTLKFKVLSNGI